MLAHLGDGLSMRKLRLFACACCRRIWGQIEAYREDYGEGTVEMFTAPVPVAEAFADGQATLEQMHGASGWLGDVGEWCSEGPEYAFMDCAGDVDRLRGVAPRIVEYGGLSVEESRAEPKAQAALLRDVFGNPFRPAAFRPAWRTAQATSLAEAAYEDRALPEGALDVERLSVLADALEEGGCTEAALLAHLRSPGPHVRGCWALDLVLGRL
jgi:hypothetical protein